jgi:hypothetical protein
MNKRLGGLHRMSEQLEKEKILLPLPEIKPLQSSIIQPAAFSLYLLRWPSTCTEYIKLRTNIQH